MRIVSAGLAFSLLTPSRTLELSNSRTFADPAAPALPTLVPSLSRPAACLRSITESKETPPSQPDPPQEDATPGKPAAAPLPAAATAAAAAAAKAAEELRRKEKEKETTRQKNTRKQKMGQANFTVKDNRECPDLWRG